MRFPKPGTFSRPPAADGQTDRQTGFYSVWFRNGAHRQALETRGPGPSQADEDSPLERPPLRASSLLRWGTGLAGLVFSAAASAYVFSFHYLQPVLFFFPF